MIDNIYIKDYIPSVSMDSLVQNILNRMQDFQVEHLAVVKDGKYVGIISEEQLLDCNQESNIKECHCELNYLFVMDNQHFLEAAAIMKTHKITAVPIINDKSEYQGMITRGSVLSYLTDSLMTTERGGIIVMSVPRRKYSIAEISRVVESENAKILGVLVRDKGDTLELVIKLSTQDIFPISSTLERLGYTVMDTYVEGSYTSSFKDHYDYLLNYLDI